MMVNGKGWVAYDTYMIDDFCVRPVFSIPRDTFTIDTETLTLLKKYFFINRFFDNRKFNMD